MLHNNSTFFNERMMAIIQEDENCNTSRRRVVESSEIIIDNLPELKLYFFHDYPRCATYCLQTHPIRDLPLYNENTRDVIGRQPWISVYLF
jgi:hypothetical protein